MGSESGDTLRDCRKSPKMAISAISHVVISITYKHQIWGFRIFRLWKIVKEGTIGSIVYLWRVMGALYWQLDAAKTVQEVTESLLEFIEDLSKNREGPNVDDLKNKDIRQLMHQQKRLMFQQFIDLSGVLKFGVRTSLKFIYQYPRK